MVTKVEIYQVCNDIEERHDISFMNYGYVSKVVPNLKKDLKSYYEKKYEFEEDFGTHTNEEILEMMFYKFNMERPEDFKGHSLSTSDIIILNDDAMWFCDSYVWQELE